MSKVEHDGKVFAIDDDGFLTDYKQWCNEWVNYVKKTEGIDVLTNEHNEVIQFLRSFMKKIT